ncbi:MAG TPA: tetratricopeptide repeat protein, partial [Methylocella sp.]|nr:tetratricopeptide repeat protein [Methylocella sp.]
MIRETGACFWDHAPALGQFMAGAFGKGDRIKVFAALVQNAKLARRRRTGACALLLAASLPLAGCETATSIMGKQGTGVAEVAHQSPQEAASNLASLTDVIQRNPASAEAYNTRGVAYARIGKFQEAIADFGQSIKLAPGNAASLTNRALAYRQINRDDAALADFNGAVAADSNHAPAYLGRANLLRVQGKLDEARSDLDQAIKLNPENAQAF